MSSICDKLDNDTILSSSAKLEFPDEHTYSLLLRIAIILAGILGLLFISLGGLCYFAFPLFVLATIYTLSAFNGTEISVYDGYSKS